MACLLEPVRAQLEALIPLLGARQQASPILAAFDDLCGESLGIDVRQRAPELSRINADGTPFQFALKLSRKQRAPALQFLGEAGPLGGRAAPRRHAAFACLDRLAQRCGLASQLAEVAPILQMLAPGDDKDLLADTSGVFWFALAFSPDHVAAAPVLTVYANARWGLEPARWQRLADLAAFLDARPAWRAIASGAPPGLTPLGVALSLSVNRPLSARLYLQAFGQPLAVYRRLFMAACRAPQAADVFDGFARQMLGDALAYPTRSAVFSAELQAGRVSGAKFELCAHCAFSSDRQAAERTSAWLEQLAADDAPYRLMLAQLEPGRPRRRPRADRSACLHAFVGVGLGAPPTDGAESPEPYASVYLNPGAALGHS